MKKLFFIIFLFFLITFLCFCNKKVENSVNKIEGVNKIVTAEDIKVDSSTDEKYNTTMKAIADSLNIDEKKELENAIKIILFSEAKNVYEISINPENIQRKVKNRLHGKTANEIVAEGNRIKTEKIAEEKEAEKKEILFKIEETKKKIVELEHKNSETEKAKENLKKIIIINSRFYFLKTSYSVEEAIIELTVKNETQHVISRIYFQGILSSIGRSIPWVKEDFNYKIPGDLEPGEQVTWKLSPNMFSKWENAPKDRNDLMLNLTTIRIDGKDEKTIYEANFSEEDKKNLEMLNNELIELTKKILIK